MMVGVEDRLEPLLAHRPWAMPPEQIVAELDVLVPWLVQAQAALLARIRELDGQGIARRDGATSPVAWLRNRYRMGTATALRYVRLAAALDQAPEPVREAVAGAEVNLDQAEVIVRAIEALPREVGPEVRELAGKDLVRLAGEFDPADLKTAGQHILRVVAPDAADDAERTALEREEARSSERRAFTMTPCPTGAGMRVSGHLTSEGAATVRAAIEPLCSPAHIAGGDMRSAAQRRADAVVEVCRLALNTTELPRNGGDRPQVVVNIDYDILAQELGAGTLDNGDRVTPETARRMACDCRLLPIVFDGHGQPLDAGRTRRLVGGVLRQALVARDRGCTFPGCDRGPRWTDGHHIRPWAAGGPTALNNLTLLCQHHHTEIHKPDGWAVYMAPDGFPTYIPPRHIDPGQETRRNTYHLRQ
jgi:hypothetical protein